MRNVNAVQNISQDSIPPQANGLQCVGIERGITRRNALRAGLGLCAAPLVSRFVIANDVNPEVVAKSEWTSFRNGPRLLGLSSAQLPDKPEVLWTLDAPDGVTATAAIAGGKVYVADLSGRLRRVDRVTGTVEWTYNSVEKPDPKSFAPGFKASPTLTDDLVYIGDEDGVFHAIDRTTGKKKWTFETGAEVISSATVDGDRVLFGSYDNTLYCLNCVTGEKLWEVVTEGYVHCTPAVISGRTYIAGCDEHLRGIDVQTGEVKTDMPIGTYLIASPAARDGLLYFGTYGAKVIAVDPLKSEIVWVYEAGRDLPFHASAAVTDKLVVVGGRDKLVHAIDRATGKGVWTFPTRSKIDSSTAIVGDRVYVGSSDRNLYCLNLADGKELWTHNVGAAVTASPAIGEGVLVIGGDAANAQIFCLGAK